jgi:protein-S-isoprenylcysteine O-methyltransferase Ste14
MSGQRDSAGVIAPPPAIYLAFLGVGFVIEIVLPSASPPGAIAWPVGGVLLAAGLSLMATFVREFRRARTAISPFEPTSAIVAGGPYRFTRNPAYLGMALVFAGIAVVSGSLWVLVALFPAVLVIDRGVIAREERYLERRFGDEYLRYKARVRRWA